MSETTISPGRPATDRPGEDETTERPPRQLLDALSRYTLLLLLVFFVALFSILEPDAFATSDNFRAIASQQVVVVLLAVAATVPLIVGEFDVSVGYIAGLTQALGVGLMAKSGVPIPVAMIVVVALAAVVGTINGFLVVVLEVNALIATLAVGSVLVGIVDWYTGGVIIYKGVPEGFTQIAQLDALGVPRPIWYGVIVVALVAAYFSFAPGGRRLYAIGGNRQAALLNGIRVRRNMILAFVFSGFLSGIAGLLVASQVGSAQPGLGGQYLLPAFAAAFLGATAFRPGRFNILGSVVAVYVLAVPIAGLQTVGVPNWVQDIFYGVALVVAVAASGQVKKLRLRRARQAKLRLTIARTDNRQEL